MSGSTTTAIYGLLAQLAEQQTINPWAAGSNPAQPAICSSGETGKRGGFKSRFTLGSTPSWSIYIGVQLKWQSSGLQNRLLHVRVVLPLLQ